MKIYIKNTSKIYSEESIDNKIVAYHASDNPPNPDGSFPFSFNGYTYGIHCGTMAAAKDRAKKTNAQYLYEFTFDKSNNAVEFRDLLENWEPGVIIRQLISMDILPSSVWDKHLLAKRNLMPKLGTQEDSPKLDEVLLSALKDANIPYFYYTNDVEDIGSTSFIIFLFI